MHGSATGSRAFRRVETLSKHLAATDDWNLAVKRYADDHDAYYGKLHGILGWMTELIWSGGPTANARRGRVFAALKMNPMGFPDAVGRGPFGPTNGGRRAPTLGRGLNLDLR